MKPPSRIGLASLSVAAIAASGLFLAPASPASAHGYVGGSSSTLISRAAWSANADRGSVQYEPQSLEGPQGFPAAGPADGQLASAGGLFGGRLDAQSATRWAKNSVQAGPVQVAWNLTAAHRTASWRYFITKQGWDPNDKLDRSDFEPLATFDGRGELPSMTTTHTLTIPADHTGYHVIYAVWDIADTVNAFYNTIDIDVQAPGTAVPVTPVTAAPTAAPTPAPSTTPSAAAPSSHHHGAHDHAAPTAPAATTPVTPATPAAPRGVHTMGRTPTSADLMWSGAAGATSYRIERSLDGTTFTAVGSTTRKRFLDTGLTAGTTYRYRIVALSDAGEATSSVLTVTTPDAPATTAPATPAPKAPSTAPAPKAPAAGIPEWKPNGVYVRGDLRRHNGVVYRAQQSHRGWGDPSWITALALWQPTTAPGS